MTLSVGWFTTARGPGSRGMFEAVLGAIEAREIDARIACVFSNRDPHEDPATDAFFDLVRAHQIPLVTRSSVAFRRAHDGARSRPGEALPPWRIAYDRAVDDALAPYPFDLGVLAGYMLIFEREFVARHALLNLHPALPGGPSGTWREVIRTLIRSGVTPDAAPESGAMLHLAVAEVDAGPVTAYCRFPLHDAPMQPLWAALGDPQLLTDEVIEASALFTAIRERGLVRERPLLVATLAAFADGRLRVQDGRPVDAMGQPAPPADLTADVEARLTATGGRGDRPAVP